MPRAPRDREAATPKKRTRKAAEPVNGNGIHAENGNGAVGTSVTAPPPAKQPEPQLPSSLEEQIRLRAYHLYLQRGGRGGSPEQDWLRAKEEICGRQSVA